MGDYICKLCMYMGNGVIFGFFLIIKSFVISKLCFIMI